MPTAISRYGTRVIPNTLQVIDALSSRGELVEGPHVAAFERAFSERLGGWSCVSASYGRMAFHYLLRALDLAPGSEVIFPALTFWVVPEMARVLGLTPVFADVDPATFNMTAASLEQVITPRTRAVVPTHLWGLPCDMREIVAVARRAGLYVIEDCAHAFGATYKGRPVGTLGDASFFSFQTIKPLNSYGGGMAVVQDPAIATEVRALAASARLPDEGLIKDKLWRGRVHRLATRADVFTWTLFPLVYLGSRLNWSIDMYFWEKIRPLDPLPFDYHTRYANVQAAIALEGLGHLDRWQAATTRHAEHMSALLRQVPGVRVPNVPADRTHAYYQYSAYVPRRDEVVSRCLRRGVDIETLHVDLCPSLPIFQAHRRPAPGAALAADAIQIPVYESLTDAQVERVGRVVAEAVGSLDMGEHPLPARPTPPRSGSGMEQHPTTADA